MISPEKPYIMRRFSFLFFTIVIFLSFLSGCKGKQVESDYPESSLIDTFEVKQQRLAYSCLHRRRSAALPEPAFPYVRYSSFRKLFNDLNDKHLAVAKKNGIEPLESLDDARNLGFWKLAKIDSCEYYTVDKLTHSIPYLTPKTKWLLMKIGKNFQDSLTNRGSGGRQIILTSALRSDESIKSLRRRNTNASENSAHRYGTTFDIAYNRYNVTDSTYFVPSDRLRILLGEVLYDLRKEHKCYIKYEIRQGCFHITAR